MTSKTSKRNVQAAQRREEAWKLRRAGWSLQQIATELGVSKSAVHKMIIGQLEESQATVSELARIERELQLERLDVLWNSLYSDAIAPQASALAGGRLAIIDRLLKIAERRAKLLGLDAPTKMMEGSPDDSEKYNPYENMTQEQRLARLREVFAREGLDIPEQ